MAYHIRRTGQVGRDIIGPTSRYSNSQVYQYSDNYLITFEIYKRKPSLADNAQWMEITPEYEFRPDLVSDEVYGAPDFWWRIMEANYMKDIIEFRAGRTIKLPSYLL